MALRNQNFDSKDFIGRTPSTISWLELAGPGEQLL